MAAFYQEHTTLDIWSEGKERRRERKYTEERREWRTGKAREGGVSGGLAWRLAKRKSG